MKWKIEKSKQGPVTNATGEYWFNIADASVDQADEVITLAGDYGIVDTSSKGWYGYKGEKYRKDDLASLFSNADEIQLVKDTIASLNVGSVLAIEDELDG